MFFAESSDIYPHRAPTAGVPRLVSLLRVRHGTDRHGQARLAADPKETEQQEEQTQDGTRPKEKRTTFARQGSAAGRRTRHR